MNVFISYSHLDKRVARRVQRRLGAHGIDAWLDERQLRAGAALTSAIRRHIAAADLVLVVASSASAASKWVALEVGCAQEHGKPVVPFFIDPVAEHALFRDHVGMDATVPQGFADALQRLMADLLATFDQELPPPDPARLEAGLRELAKEEPAVAPLVHGCLDGQGLHQESMETVHAAAFHAVDEALDALSDLRPGESTAYHLASGFAGAGAGMRGLLRWIAASGDGGLPLVGAVRGVKPEPALLAAALALLGACEPPNNHALYSFIDRHAGALDAAQRRTAIRLATWPVREDTGRLADVLGWVALRHFPEAPEIGRMWTRWIHNGAFDDEARALARYLADADRAHLPAATDLVEALRSHVRTGLRSGDKNRVVAACDHLRAAADAAAAHLGVLLREASGVSGTAEWNRWRELDPEAAEWSRWYVLEITEAAQGDRDWLGALQSAQKMVEFERMRRGLARDGEPAE